MKIKNKVIFILLILIIIVIAIFLFFKKQSSSDVLVSSITNTENLNTINKLEDTADEKTNIMTNEIIPTEIIVEDKNIQETETKNDTKKDSNTASNISNDSNKSSSSNNTVSTKDDTTSNNSSQASPTKPIKPEVVEDKKDVENTNEKDNQNTISKDDSTQDTQDTPIKEDNSRPDLAYTTYRQTNTANVQEIINILNSEIAKDTDLVDFGSKAIKGNKADAYSKTTCFTYLFVDDINKGKVQGNYTSFPQRVKNNVGSFGTYYVYAEDEYAYDSRGLNPKWSQTLVWIYVEF